MSRDVRDLEHLDVLLREQARSPAPAVAGRVFERLGRPPRRVSRRRPVAFALAAATLLVGAGAGFGWWLGGRAPAPVASAQPAVRTVYFALAAPGARSVVLVGDFNGWEPERGARLVDGGDGRFVAALELPPGRYAYAFVVDGAEVRTDPAASVHEADGFGGQNAILEL